MSKIKLITFDVMNTILKTKLSIGEEYSAIASRHGLKVDSQRISKEFPKVFKGLWDVQPNFGVSKGISARDWWHSAVHATFDRSGVNLDDAESFEKSAAAADALYEHYSTPAPWTLVGPYDDLIGRLRKNRTLGIISNFDERLEGLLSALGIFDMALDKAGLADGSCALHVGDSIRLDYKAAKDAGWNAVWLCKDTALLAQYPVDKSEVISDLAALENLPILRRLDQHSS